MQIQNVLSSLAVAIGLCAGGCIQPDYVDKITPLAEMPGLEILVRVDRQYPRITLHYDHEELGGCAIATPSLRARFDDMPLIVDRWGRGHYTSDNELSECEEPALVLVKQVVSLTRWVVEDDSLTLTGELP